MLLTPATGLLETGLLKTQPLRFRFSAFTLLPLCFRLPDNLLLKGCKYSQPAPQNKHYFWETLPWKKEALAEKQIQGKNLGAPLNFVGFAEGPFRR